MSWKIYIDKVELCPGGKAGPTNVRGRSDKVFQTEAYPGADEVDFFDRENKSGQMVFDVAVENADTTDAFEYLMTMLQTLPMKGVIKWEKSGGGRGLTRLATGIAKLVDYRQMGVTIFLTYELTFGEVRTK